MLAEHLEGAEVAQPLPPPASYLIQPWLPPATSLTPAIAALATPLTPAIAATQPLIPMRSHLSFLHCSSPSIPSPRSDGEPNVRPHAFGEDPDPPAPQGNPLIASRIALHTEQLLWNGHDKFNGRIKILRVAEPCYFLVVKSHQLYGSPYALKIDLSTAYEMCPPAPLPVF